MNSTFGRIFSLTQAVGRDHAPFPYGSATRFIAGSLESS